MADSHRMRIYNSDYDNRQKRIVLPSSNTADIKKKGFFSEKEVGEDQKIVNISEGGMQTIARGDVNVGDKVKLTLHIKELDNPVEVIGRVKWKKPVPREIYYRIGIEFTSIPEYAREKLEEIINDPLVIEYGKENK